MKSAILISLVLLLVGWSTCPPFACNLANIKQDIALMEGVMGSLNDTRKPLQNATDFRDKFYNIFGNLQADSAICWSALLSQYIATTANIEIPVFTDQCFFDGVQDPSTFMNDPCCNPNLQSNTCCKKRMVKRRVRVAQKLTNAVESCNHPQMMKRLIRRATRDFAERKNACQAKLDQAKQELQTSIESMQQCLQKVLNNDVPCKDDTQCESGFCDPTSRVCVTPGRLFSGNATDMVDCLIQSLPEPLRRGFYARYNLVGNFTDAVREQMIAKLLAGEITSPQCLDRNFLPVAGNNASCLEKTVCNDLQDTNQVTGKCNTQGGFCASICRNGICQSASLDQFSCQALSSGICFKDGNHPFKANKTECENIFGCTDPKCYNDNPSNCTQNACVQYGRCNGYPFDFDYCAFPKINNNGHMMCPQGAIDLGQNMGCRSMAYNTKPQCELNNGKWIPNPKSKEECEGIKLCFDRKTFQFSPKTLAECNDCGGVMRSPFKWQGARWESAVWREGFMWKNRTEVQVNKMVDAALDERKFGKLLEELMDIQQKMFMKNTLFCLHNPQLSFFKVWLQDCGPQRENIGDFFNSTMPIGEIPAFNGTIVEQDLMDAFVRLGNKTFTAEEGEVKRVVKKMLLWESDSLDDTTARAVNFIGPRAASNVIYVVENNENMGQVMGDGISVDCTSCDLTLCLKIDAQITKVSDSLNIPAFAYQADDGKFYKDTSVSEISDQTDQICGKVSQKKVYYPAYMSNSPIPPPQPPKPSSAMSLKVSFVLLAILALFMF